MDSQPRCRVIRSCYHKSRSFVPGSQIAHFWIKGCVEDELNNKWRIFSDNNLVSSLHFGDSFDGITHAYCKLSHFLDIDTLCHLIVNECLTPAEVIKVNQAQANKELFEATFGIHYYFCKKNKIPVTCGFLGSFPYTMMGFGRYARLFIMNMRPSSNCISSLVGTNKSVCRSYLKSFGLPVADGATVWGYDMAHEVASNLKGPIVVKSPTSSNSEKVFIGIQTSEQLTHALRNLGGHMDQYIIEEEVKGCEYRVYFSNGKLHSVWRGKPKSVTGDGCSSLGKLIHDKYPQLMNEIETNTHLREKLLKRTIGYEVYSLTDLNVCIPEKGKSIPLSPAISASTLHLVESSMIHEDDVKTIESMLATLGFPSCGIDLILKNEDSKLIDSGVILEMNIPCGFGYLNDPKSVIEREIKEELSAIEDFWSCQGDLDIGIIHADEVFDENRNFTSFFESLSIKVRQNSGSVLFPKGIFEWSMLLNNDSSSSFLLVVDDDVIIDNGLPGSNRLIWHTLCSLSERQKRFPWLASFMETNLNPC